MTQTVIHTLETATDAAKPLLEGSVKAFGSIPNLHGVMATSPALLESYKELSRLAMTTGFSPAERTVIWMTINVANTCHYCVPAHTGIALREKVDKDIIDALRDETPLNDAKLESLRTFTLALRDTHGRPASEDLVAFRAAGYDDRALQDLLVIFAQKVLSNYTNALFETPVDGMFQPFAWEPKAMAAE
ncbi:carboxymuconolactone decarboxylase family protein [Ruegeria litorea]|uniref:Carboxymuconolactone decarboxylase family protein n=1 Tax=Falsiruegeria litorea TaxID=1280831 RepID=A0ABS5WS85_9RHOB|nr:carboxymuconolactone decarboxylase family protein [Falsiruegeria litorea]MBT3141984.1 carboxymuconolactone decarboxylase family protein [Falsiruegeria litorea]